MLAEIVVGWVLAGGFEVRRLKELVLSELVWVQLQDLVLVLG